MGHGGTSCPILSVLSHTGTGRDNVEVPPQGVPPSAPAEAGEEPVHVVSLEGVLILIVLEEPLGYLEVSGGILPLSGQQVILILFIRLIVCISCFIFTVLKLI